MGVTATHPGEAQPELSAVSTCNRAAFLVVMVSRYRATWCSPQAMQQHCDMIIGCLSGPACGLDIHSNTERPMQSFCLQTT
jgi:hypothetical protein